MSEREADTSRNARHASLQGPGSQHLSRGPQPPQPSRNDAVWIAARCLLGGKSGASAVELMNAFVASGGIDSEVLGVIVGRYRPLVLNGLRRERVPPGEAENVANRVWERMWKIGQKTIGMKGSWNPGRCVHGADPFETLLGRVVISRARDFHRRRRTEAKRLAKMEEVADVFGEDWRLAVGRRREIRRAATANGQRADRLVAGVTRRDAAAARSVILEVVERLPEKAREVLELHAEGHTNIEITALVGASAGEVSKRLSRARSLVLGELVGVGAERA
jgi:RNA polymerase sigma factor (sigma-70 family)